MASIYVTNVGDDFDLICYREYGAQAGVVEKVLEANPHIADVAHDLPVGVKIALPDLGAREVANQGPKLWD